MFVPMLVTDFTRRAETQYAKKIGVVDGEKRFTYGEYVERTRRLSNGLLNLGVKKGDRVAFIDYNTHRLLEAFYGIPQMGAILLFINIRFSPREIAFILNDSEAKYVVVNENLIHLINPIKDELKTVEQYILLPDSPTTTDSKIGGANYEDILKQSSPFLPEIKLDENDPAEMCYTSGTTGGQPKGMLFTHRMLYFNAINGMFVEQVNDRSVFLHAIPLFHVNGWGTPHFLTAAGGKHVLLREFRPELACRAIEEERVTNMFVVPTMAITLLNYPDLAKHDLSSLKQLRIGGAPVSAALFRAVEEKIGCEVYSGYGLTETLPLLATSRGKDYLSHLSGEERVEKLRRSGLADFMANLRVVNEKGEDVKPDGREIGEVITRGNNIIDEYWKLPEEAKATIITGWFHTGDLANIDEDGYIQIVDRLKDIVISGGENISTFEVENAIYTHPAVLECAVVAAPHEVWGETPAALVVLKEGHSITEAELLAHCKTQLAGFKVPKLLEIVDSLPKGGTGKILKRELRKRYWSKDREKR